MLAVLAEMERELIVERTQAGLQAARKLGMVGGRPRVDKKSGQGPEVWGNRASLVRWSSGSFRVLLKQSEQQN